MAKQAAFFFLSPQKCASDSAKNSNGQLIITICLTIIITQMHEIVSYCFLFSRNPFITACFSFFVAGSFNGLCCVRVHSSIKEHLKDCKNRCKRGALCMANENEVSASKPAKANRKDSALYKYADLCCLYQNLHLI
jgi:hypothetical protein